MHNRNFVFAFSVVHCHPPDAFRCEAGQSVEISFFLRIGNLFGWVMNKSEFWWRSNIGSGDFFELYPEA